MTLAADDAVHLPPVRLPGRTIVVSGAVTVMVRPEAVEFAGADESGFEATYLSSAYLGAVTEFVFDVAGTEVFVTMYGGGLTDARKGDRVRLRLKPAGVSLLPAA